jgi:hypothetical protein
MSDEPTQGYTPEVRRISFTIGETGAEDRTEDTYQLGAIIDGGFVPFVTKSAGYIDHLAENDRQRQEQESGDEATSAKG